MSPVGKALGEVCTIHQSTSASLDLHRNVRAVDLHTHVGQTRRAALNVVDAVASIASDRPVDASLDFKPLATPASRTLRGFGFHLLTIPCEGFTLGFGGVEVGLVDGGDQASRSRSSIMWSLAGEWRCHCVLLLLVL